MTANPLPLLKDVIRSHGISAKKSLGQHFLLDPSVNRRIVGLAGNLDGRHIVEVGPGPGGLTRALLETPAQSVTVVEIDQRAWPALEALKEMTGDKLCLVKQDALKLNLVDLCPSPRAIVSNLPYNVGTPLFIAWLRQAQDWESFTLMFQAEVAERLTASPSSKAYGRLSVLTQWCGTCSIAMKLPPGAFSPPPKIDSAVIHFVPYPTQPSKTRFAAMERLTGFAFGQRRKMLRTAMKMAGGTALLERASIDPSRRAETLSVHEFDQLVNAYLADDQISGEKTL